MTRKAPDDTDTVSFGLVSGEIIFQSESFEAEIALSYLQDTSTVRHGFVLVQRMSKVVHFRTDIAWKCLLFTDIVCARHVYFQTK